MQPSLPETACHSHPQHNRRILRLSFLLISGFMLLEFLGGYFFHSLALMADAGHMANDSLALALAWLAQFLGTRNRQRLALASGGSLIILALWIIVAALLRLRAPAPPLALPMLAVAATGLAANIVVARLMLHSDHDNLNLRAAYLHVLADLLGSLVAIAAALGVWLFGWAWMDAVASLLLSLFVLKSGVAVVREAWRQYRVSADQPLVQQEDAGEGENG